MSKKSQQVHATAGAERAPTFVIEQPKTARTAVEIGGRSLIQNAFSQKAIEEMLRKHMGLTVQREKKNPRKVIEQAIVRNVDGVVCMPPVSFKAAMITASGALKTFERKKTALKTSLFIVGESVPIEFEKMIPRMDMVRTAGIGRTPDVRFRPNFINWKARLIIEYAETVLQVQSVIDLLQRGGSVGVGEWRPEKNGTHGTFRVVRAITDRKELAAVEAACLVPLKTPEIPEWAIDADIDMTMLAKLFAPAADGETADEEEPTKARKRA